MLAEYLNKVMASNSLIILSLNGTLSEIQPESHQNINYDHKYNNNNNNNNNYYYYYYYYNYYHQHHHHHHHHHRLTALLLWYLD